MGPEIVFWSRQVLLPILIAGTVGYTDLLDSLAAQEIKSAIGVIVPTAVTMLGFVLASLAVLATIAQTKLVRNMSKTGHYGLLLNRMFSCLIVFGLVAVLGMALLLVPTISKTAVLLVIALTVLAATLLGDVLLKLKMSDVKSFVQSS